MQEIYLWRTLWELCIFMHKTEERCINVIEWNVMSRVKQKMLIVNVNIIWKKKKKHIYFTLLNIQYIALDVSAKQIKQDSIMTEAL